MTDRRPFSPGTPIEIAEQEGVDLYALEVSQVVTELLGHDEALVTDESRVSDFLCMVDTDPENQRRLAALSERLGRPVHRRALIWELARDLHLRQQTHSIH
jgi:hypothetical protein